MPSFRFPGHIENSLIFYINSLFLYVYDTKDIEPANFQNGQDTGRKAYWTVVYFALPIARTEISFTISKSEVSDRGE